jgi:AcrR family transcriptional regulator
LTAGSATLSVASPAELTTFAVVLREATRRVGVVPNAAYRHFSDRDALLAAVRDEAIKALAARMADGMHEVRAGAHTPTGARLRLQAIGKADLAFARTEPGIFETAFTASDHASA